MKTSQPIVIEKAEFNPNVRKYWLLNGGFALLVTIIGIPLIPLWYLLGMWITGRYLSRMECILTQKTLIVRKGVLNRVEKTVPLEKITDLGLMQGPLMRLWNLHALTVETAGQSGPGSLVKLHGIMDVEEFRDTVLTQRDRLMASSGQKMDTHEVIATEENSLTLLREMRDALNVLVSRGEEGK